jgi:hypothetical protein
MQKKYLISIVIVSIVIISLVFFLNMTPTSKKITETQKDKILEIQLKIDAPFSTASLTIFQDGSALYSRKQRGEDEKETIYEAGTFTVTELKTISEIVYKNNFFSLKDKPYTEDSPLDGSTYTISIKAVSSYEPELADAFVHSVSCYQFNCEKGFLEIREIITDTFGEEILEVGV